MEALALAVAMLTVLLRVHVHEASQALALGRDVLDRADGILAA